ncbi:MAG: class I SAM-dependent methyltransferase, partial [Streptosporangiaceae bacterium]
MRVLDIGCGWGSFARFAAERYRARVDGITLSPQQLALGQNLCAGLPVQLRLEDYREVQGRYDRIVSLGMFEHVGARNYRTYFDAARRCLTQGGRMFLSTIGSNRTVRSTDPWIERYIFPNSHLPSIQQIGRAIEQRFAAVEWQNWAADYDRTLMAWFANFEAQWERWQRQYSERFCRMWKFYLLSSAAAFRSRHLQVWQILLEPLGA